MKELLVDGNSNDRVQVDLDPDAPRQRGGKHQASQPKLMLKEASADQMFNAHSGD